jgi:hypothetical protein
MGRKSGNQNQLPAGESYPLSGYLLPALNARSPSAQVSAVARISSDNTLVDGMQLSFRHHHSSKRNLQRARLA